MNKRIFTLEFYFYDDDKESTKMTTTQIFNQIINDKSDFYKRCLDILIEEVE